MKRLLIVDDDAGIRDSLTEALSDEYAVLTASSGREARSMLQRLCPDVILLDMVMADGDGLSLLGALRQVYPQAAAVVFTVRDEIKSVIVAMQLGADDYLIKPSSAPTIRQALRKALADRNRRVVSWARQGAA